MSDFVFVLLKMLLEVQVLVTAKYLIRNHLSVKLMSVEGYRKTKKYQPNIKLQISLFCALSRTGGPLYTASTITVHC